MRAAAALIAAAALMAAGPAAQAEPAGKTTLEETLNATGAGPFRALVAEPGEPFKLRRWSGLPAGSKRAGARKSLVFFGQLTDSQIVDPASPVRFDWGDPAGGPVSSGWRPQEAFELQVIDQLVRNVNANSTSEVAQAKDKRAKLGFVLETGDFADNQQVNEVKWGMAAMDGGAVDPLSGVPATADNCPSLSDSTRAQINADLAARRYTGVQDYGDYGDAPDARKSEYWDPDAAPPSASSFAGWPLYPGLMDRSRQPFVAEGFKVPWYAVRGNHDALVQGNLPANNPIVAGLITGCQKVFPSSSFDPAEIKGLDEAAVIKKLNDPEFQQKVLAGLRPIAPDPNRRFVPRTETRSLYAGRYDDHGFGFVDKKEDKAAGGVATYYAFARNGIRFVGLDTNAEGGGNDGNLDDPQYKWLKGELATSQRKHRLIVVYAHHGIENMGNANADEKAGTCQGATDAGCDRDPRKSTPLHLGTRGKNTVKELLLRYPNVIAYVVGHSHHNLVAPYRAKGNRWGFWEVNTASHVDFPQQARMFDVMDNRDGTLSLFSYLIDTAAPVAPPGPGSPASPFTDAQVASISRAASANDPQGKGPGSESPGRGGPNDRNVEAMLRDPRKLK